MNTFHDIVLRPYPLGRRLLPFILVLGACGGDGNNDAWKDPANVRGDGATGGNVIDREDEREPGTVPPTPDGDADDPAPPCDEARMQAIRASIDEAIPDTIDGVAFVKEPSCGERYFTHGPSQYPITTGHFIASNTKTYVASLILLLVDDGLLTLDDSISKWIDNVPGGDTITVRQTLNHSSGIFSFTQDSGWQTKVNLKIPFTPEELINIGFSHAVYFPPGQGYRYSNTNYVILGRIAEKVSNKPLEQLLRQRILEPIGAKHTYLRGKEEPLMELAVGKKANGATETSWGPTSGWAAGAMAATVDDLGRWVELRGSKAFHSAAANAALFDTIPTDVPEYRQGAGMFEFASSWTHGGGIGFGHAGDVPGYHSWGIYFPEKKTAVAVVVDSDAGVGQKYYSEILLFAILDPLFGYVGGSP